MPAASTCDFQHPRTLTSRIAWHAVTESVLCPRYSPESGCTPPICIEPMFGDWRRTCCSSTPRFSEMLNRQSDESAVNVTANFILRLRALTSEQENHWIACAT